MLLWRRGGVILALNCGKEEIVQMSSVFCSSQLNQYVPCGSCLWVMTTGRQVSSEISHFLSGKRQNCKQPTRSSRSTQSSGTNRTSGATGRSCVRDEKLSARNWSGICVQAHTSSPRGHGSGQLHVKFMRGTSFRFTQGGNKEAIKTLKDNSHNKQNHVALKKLLTVHRLHGCYQHPTL